MIGPAIPAQLERASHQLDALISDIRADKRSARTLEDVEERVKDIASGMLVAVRGPTARL